jgi:hypothetical protein
MRKIKTPPYCRLRTKTKVKYKTYDKSLQPVTVRGHFKFDSFWHPAHNLRQLLTECGRELKSKYSIKKLDAKQGTADGIPLEIIPTPTFPEDNFTAADLGAPHGYRYWQVLPDVGKVRLLSIWAHDQKQVDDRDKLGKKIAADERYLPPVEVPVPAGWKVIAPLLGFLGDRCRRPPISAEQAQAKLAALLDGSISHALEEVFGWPGQDELVPLVFKKRIPRKNSEAKFWEADGMIFGQSEKVLYRMLHYFSPLRITGFYKGHMIRLHHPKGLAWADIGTFKCAMEIRLFVDKSICTQVKSASIVREGRPGAQKDEISCPESIKAWYSLLTRLLETKTLIYGGNNFEV